MSLLRNLSITALLSTTSLFVVQPVKAALITFDDLVSGQTSSSFDGDGDGINDVTFSTTDPSGFNTTGPGLNQLFINEPGLDGTSLLDPDLRVEFLYGATDSLSFGFAVNSSFESSTSFATFNLFDSDGNSLAETNKLGVLGTSSYPEGQIQVNFSGVAAYGTFNLGSEFGRYIIDNFQGTFGSKEVVDVPEPATILGSGIALGFGALFVKRKRKQCA